MKLFPKAQFSGYDILPFFFIVACQLLTQETKQPSFLPYGFLLYFILGVIVSVYTAIKSKNISVAKTLRDVVALSGLLHPLFRYVATHKFWVSIINAFSPTVL